MLRKLKLHPELELLCDKNFISGRVLRLVHCWCDTLISELRFESIRDSCHFSAWQRFNAVSRKISPVGIFHERCVLSNYKTVAVNIASDFEFSIFTRSIPTSQIGDQARERLEASND